MVFSRTALQMASRSLQLLKEVSPGLSHSEKLMCLRPSSTCLRTGQETGATLAYQGQMVSLEWQSKQARWKMF